MRIPEPSGNFGEDKSILGKTKKSGDKRIAKGVQKDAVNQNAFLRELDGAVEEQVKRSLDELIKDLDDQAKVVEKVRTFGELEKYKKMVKDFMQEVIKKIYTVKISDSSKLMQKRKKVYMMVEQIDAELAKMTNEVLVGQSSGITLLSTLDRIRGLLVDMYS